MCVSASVEGKDAAVQSTMMVGVDYWKTHEGTRWKIRSVIAQAKCACLAVALEEQVFKDISIFRLFALFEHSLFPAEFLDDGAQQEHWALRLFLSLMKNYYFEIAA